MSQKALNTIDSSTVTSISLTESHHGRRPVWEEPLKSASIDAGTLKLTVGSHPDAGSPLADVDLSSVVNVQLLNSEGTPITDPEYLLGTDPVSNNNLHLFTDSTL